ncbi:MAG: hypothetical protein J6V22_02530 [Clostridia bacterium]|nr:hypothetical protein [Clostridia bacterium]
MKMGVLDCALDFFYVEVLCVGSCPESFAPDVDGVSAALDGGNQTLKASCRSKKLGEFVFSFHC